MNKPMRDQLIDQVVLDAWKDVVTKGTIAVSASQNYARSDGSRLVQLIFLYEADKGGKFSRQEYQDCIQFDPGEKVMIDLTAYAGGLHDDVTNYYGVRASHKGTTVELAPARQRALTFTPDEVASMLTYAGTATQGRKVSEAYAYVHNRALVGASISCKDVFAIKDLFHISDKQSVKGIRSFFDAVRARR